MRSFSKKLAFVLAAAMVFTAFAPAAKAEAAAMKINKSSKILYVTDGEGINDAAQVGGGKGNVAEYDFSVSNKPKDYKKTHTFKWSSSDEDVIEVGKAGLTKAVGVGVADVICVVTEKATGKATTLKSEVTVKANAAEVVITNADDYADLAYEVGAEIDLNRAMYDANGTKAPKRGVVVTDYTRWMVEPSAGVKVTQSNGKYVFTDAAEAGTYKLWCETYQSSKYQKATAKSDVIEVELVKDKSFDITQNSTTKVTLSFSSAVKSLVVSDVEVTQMVGDYPYAKQVKSVKLADDGMSATVEMFNQFANNANYAVKVKDFEDNAFVASVGTPVRMEIIAVDKNPAYVLTTNAIATVKCVFYDAKDVDVTTASNYESSVTYKLEKNATQGEYVLNNNKLTIKKDSVSAVVIANYRGKFENGKIVGALEARQEFIAQNAPAVYPTGVKAFDLDGDWDNGKTKSNLQVKEDQQELWLQLNLSNGKDAKFVFRTGAVGINAAQFTSNNNAANERITLTAVTPDVADLVSGVVKPHKAGTAVFYVNYGIKSSGKWNDVPFATVEIEVLDNVYINSVKIDNGNFVNGTSDIYELKDGTVISANDYLQNKNNIWNSNALKTLIDADADGTVTFGEAVNGVSKRAGFSQTALNLIGYDQRGGRIDLRDRVQDFASGIPEVTVKCLSDGYGSGFDAKDLAKWPYVSVYYTGDDYWADDNDTIGLTFDGAMVKNYLESKNLFDAADDGDYITLDYEVTYKNAQGNEFKSYFTVTVQEPTAGASNEYLEIKTSSGYVDISRYVTKYNDDATEKTKTVSFEVFKKSNGVNIDTVEIAKFNKATATVGALQYKIFKDGQEVTDKAYVSTPSKSNSYPFSQAQDLIKTNKITLTLTGEKTDSNGKRVPNYNDGGAGLYSFALYEWFVDDAGNLYEVQQLQSDATAVLNGTGSYSIDHNAQRKNIVSSTDKAEILKCFTIKNRDGKDVVKTENGVDKIELYTATDTYEVIFGYSTGAEFVYVKEIVFYEHLGNNVYAPYVVPVDVALVKGTVN